MIELFSYPHYTLETISTAWDWKTDTIEHHADLEKFEHEMIKCMEDEGGLGLAANQIGITKRFFAIESHRCRRLLELYGCLGKSRKTKNSGSTI